ncbi:MAG: hypothetical protein IKA78_05875 [Oscillospiraceae bacterium]|nr:hypothetical protein [Oscillospiraceae bacterium]
MKKVNCFLRRGSKTLRYPAFVRDTNRFRGREIEKRRRAKKAPKNF